MVDSTEETRIELRERTWLWFKDAYERPKESTPYVVSRITLGKINWLRELTGF